MVTRSKTIGAAGKVRSRKPLKLISQILVLAFMVTSLGTVAGPTPSADAAARCTGAASENLGEAREFFEEYCSNTYRSSNSEFKVNSHLSVADIANDFTLSAEFRQRYGPLSDQAFVELIYNNVLERPADSDGLAFWLAQLEAGQSRGSVMIGFSESSEFILKTGTIP